jgi:light-regulated signal transduction histidine kinase (bacteriophytochrome)
MAIANPDDDVAQWRKNYSFQQSSAVQGYGVLIGLEANTENSNFPVLVVSDNSENIMGRTPEELFALDSFLDLLGKDEANDFKERVDLLKDTDVEVSINGPQVFLFELISTSSSQPLKFWCALHLDPGNRNLIICEFEPDSGGLYPSFPTYNLAPRSKDPRSDTPTLGDSSQTTQKDRRLPRVYRNGKRGGGRAVIARMLDFMSRVEEQFAAAPDVPVLLDALICIMQELTGFHRIMIHRLDGSRDGHMVTDLMDPALRPYVKALDHPGPDAAEQIEDFQRMTGIQMLYDCDLSNARLLYRNGGVSELDLHLTYSYLRVVSPSYVAHTKRMDVRSSMSVSLDLPGEMWGMVVCHSYGDSGTRISFPSRRLCRFVSDVASRSIQRLRDQWHFQAWDDLNTIFVKRQTGHCPIASSDHLLHLFQADFGILSIGRTTKMLGQIDRAQEALVMLAYLRARRSRSVVASVDIERAFPRLKYRPGFRGIAGILVVPMAHKPGDMFVFFRKPQPHGTNCGEPYKPGAALVSRQREGWTENEIETANVLRSFSADLVQAWHTNDTLPISKLTQLLVSNAAHEVRTPLNAAINYLEIALEGPVGPQAREHLLRSQDKFAKLTQAVNDLSMMFAASQTGRAVG